MTNEAPTTWISAEKAAPLLDMSLKQVYRVIREGKLPSQIRFIRVGKQIRISAADVGYVETSATPMNATNVEAT